MQPDSAHFPSVGVAAMHGALQDRARTSVFFRSSPYGSLNHGHADQNAFVMVDRGRVLAMDSGAYDYYNSPHWRDYYKQTKAHNAITFDGGQGQWLGALGLGERSAGGRLTRFVHAPTHDIVVGDASAAYAGKLTLARRTLVFIRPGTLVTIDQLHSKVARKYEYWLHTGVALSGTQDAFRADLAPAELCGTVASPAALTLSREAGYTPAPTVAVGPHFGNKFSYASPSQQGLIVAVLRANCSLPVPVIRFAAGGATIGVGARMITVTDVDVSLK